MPNSNINSKTEECLVRSIISHEARIRNKSAKINERVNYPCLEISSRFTISKLTDGSYDVCMSINGDNLIQHYNLNRFYPTILQTN